MKLGIALITIGSLSLIGYIARMFFVIKFAINDRFIIPIDMNIIFSDYILFEERALLLLLIAAIFLVPGILRLRSKKIKISSVETNNAK